MALTYSWGTVEPPEVPIEQKIIVGKETITENKEIKFTLNEKQEELKRAESQVLSAQNEVKRIKGELATIKTALGIA